MKRKLLIIGVLLVVMGYLYWRTQPEQVIKRRSKSLIEMADQVSEGAGLFDIKRLEGLIGHQLKYQVDAYSSQRASANQAEVLSAYQWMGDNTKKSEFKIEEITGLSIEGNDARLKCRVVGILEMNDIRMMEGLHLVEFGWCRDSKGHWRLVELVWK